MKLLVISTPLKVVKLQENKLNFKQKTPTYLVGVLLYIKYRAKLDYLTSDVKILVNLYKFLLNKIIYFHYFIYL